jgi:alpha-mannosidase
VREEGSTGGRCHYAFSASFQNCFVFDCEGGSVIKQNVIINDYSKRVQYDVNVDWKEAHKLLKVYFPLNVRSDFATYDIQFGNLQRPTAPNTSWLVF